MSNQTILEPRVTYLENILNDIDQGYLKVPRFQRREVWEWQSQKDLLCSIFEGLPIGSILLWQTQLDSVTFKNTLGPFILPPAGNNKTQAYILDGLQRLTTLYAMVFHPEERVSRDADIAAYTVYCDLEATASDDVFYLEKELQRLRVTLPNEQYFPLKFVFKSKKVMQFQRSIIAENEHRIDRIDEIVAAFKNYKLPIVPLESNDQDMVTKSFERVNTRGQVMSATHMVNALSYKEGQFELLKLIDDYRDEYLSSYPHWYEGLEEPFILMVLKIALGMGPYDTQTDKLAKTINSEFVEQVFISLQRVVEFSQNRLWIDSPKSYPYKMQMLGIAGAFLKKPNLDEAQLTSWYFYSLYTSLFGYSARVSENALSALWGYLDSGVIAWDISLQTEFHLVPSKDISLRGSRVKAAVYAMAYRLDGYSQAHDSQANDSQANENRPNMALVLKKKGGALQLPTGFENEKKRLGLLFVADQPLNLKQLSDDDRQRHFVTAELMTLLDNRKVNEFAQQREALIFLWEKENLIEPALHRLNLQDLLVKLE